MPKYIPEHRESSERFVTLRGCKVENSPSQGRIDVFEPYQDIIFPSVMIRKLQKAIIHFWSDLAVVKIGYSRKGLDAYWCGTMNQCIAIVCFFLTSISHPCVHRKLYSPETINCYDVITQHICVSLIER